MTERKVTKEQITEFLDRFSDRISKIDDLATAVLKSHFEVEEQLNETLALLAKSPKHLEGKPSFFQKLRWVRAFGPMGDDKRWQLVLAFNELRNKIAHKPDGPERKKAMQKLRKELADSALVPLPIADEQRIRDYNVVVLSAIFSIALIVQVRDQIGK
jgi:hypothetical protein